MVKDLLSQTISERCRVLRKKLGLTQAEMAKRIGVSFRAWQSWEEGISEPRAKSLFTLIEMENQNQTETDISSLCQQIRKKLGLNRKEIAKMIGVRPHTWGYWELGTQQPNASSRILINKLVQKYL